MNQSSAAPSPLINLSAPTLAYEPGSDIKKRVQVNSLTYTVRNPYAREAKFYEQFFKAFKDCRVNVQTLHGRNVFKYAHYYLTLKQNFIYFIDQRVEFLLRNNPEEKDILKRWRVLKVQLAKTNKNESFNLSKLKSELEEFIKILDGKFRELEIDNREFKKNLDLFMLFFNFPHVPETVLAPFFEKSLQSKDLADSNAKDIYVPISTIYQSLDVLIYQFRNDLQWLIHYAKKYRKKNAVLVEKLTVERENLPEDIRRAFDSIMRTYGNIGASLQEFEVLTRPLEQFSQPSALGIQAQMHLSEVKKFHLKFQETFEVYHTNIHIRHENFIKFNEATNLLLDAIEEFSIIPYQKIDFFFSYLNEAHCALLFSFPDVQSRKEYLQKQIVPEMESCTLVQIREIPRSKSKQHAKRKSQKNRRSKASSIKLEEKRAKKEAADIPSPKKMEKQAGVVVPQKKPAPKAVEPLTFPCLATGLLSLSQKSVFDVHQKQALIHASWHLNKCHVSQMLFKKGIAAEDRLNFLSAFATSAAIAIEQTYRVRLLGKNSAYSITDITKHNLMRSHNLAYPDEPVPRAVRSLRLAIFWARFFQEEYHDWTACFSYYQERIPELLDIFIRLSTNPKDVSEEEFSAYFKKLSDEVFDFMTHYAPAVKLKAAPSKSEEFAEPIPIDVQSLAKLYISFKRLTERSEPLLETKSHLMLLQALASIEMLQRSLINLHQSYTYEEFSFWVVRSAALIQEATDRSLHTLDYMLNGYTDRSCHDIGLLSKNTSLDLGKLSLHLDHMAPKLKYPCSQDSKGLGKLLIDQSEALRLYPDLDKGFAIVPIGYAWELPSKDVTRETIIFGLTELLASMERSFTEKIIPALEENL